ncbi:hypothetical protein [Rothia mucilaginosa]|uniref:hypothetical protein n=1 Tax=Rothia mucilaginosa TaxID=43675 RepID=UPI0028E1BBB5|nr:hypothetical protein [Rothia mucilaginosa]
MTNQLLLTQVLAAGFDWNYLWHWTHDQDLGKVLISAIAPIATAVIAALSLILSARRETKQMELSKQGTPPELTRYKEWLEISEKYKELVKFGNVDALSITSEEYREIEASRKASLERAVWERKVFAFCPYSNAQKLLMQINPSKIYRIINLKNGDSVSCMDIYVPSDFKPYWMCFSFWGFLYVTCFTLLCVNVSSGNNTDALFWFVEIIFVLVLFPFFIGILPNGISGVVEANYFFRRIIVSRGQKFEISINSEREMMAKRLRNSILDSVNPDTVYYPWEGKNSIIAIFMKIVTYFSPGYYVRKGFKNADSVLWGSYKEELLNGDLKEKLGRKGTQVPNSDTPEESQPTHPQG